MVSAYTFIPFVYCCVSDGHHRVTLCNHRTGKKIVWIALVFVLLYSLGLVFTSVWERDN